MSTGVRLLMMRTITPKLARTLAPAVITLVVFAGLEAPARADDSIQGVWSFNGGSVAIQPRPDGSFIGTVVAPTTFARCSHPIGERMWSDMRLQPDGSYWGEHQWFLEPTCSPNLLLGPTAWRVIEAPDGERFLRACFSYPADTQPTIAPDATSANVTSPPCVDSAKIAPLPREAPSASPAAARQFARAVSFPSTHKCLSKRTIQVHLYDPKNDPIREVLVLFRGHRIAVRRRASTLLATIELGGLPAGEFTVKIRVRTVLGHHLRGSRTYRTCVPRRARPRGRKNP
jgi:hypothetical protein